MNVMPGRGPDKKPRKPRANKRGLILLCAMNVFSYYGYDGASLEKIAVGAGVAKTLVVKYFGTKEKLAEECVIDFIEKFAHKVDLIAEKEPTYQQNVERVAGLFKRYQKELRFLLALSITPANAHLADQIWLSMYTEKQEPIIKYRDQIGPELFPDMIRSMAALHFSYVVMDDEKRYDSARKTMLEKYLGSENDGQR